MAIDFSKPRDGSLSLWIQPEHFEHLKVYKDAEVWAETFVAGNMACPADAAEMALTYAKDWYTQADARRKAVDDKLLEHLKAAGALLAAEFAIVKIGNVPPGWLLVASAICAVVAMILALLGRRSHLKPWPPSIRETMEGLAHAGLPDKCHRMLWLAANYYPVCVATDKAIDFCAAYEKRASGLLVGAVALLAGALIALAA